LEKSCLRDLAFQDMIILKWILKTCYKCVNLIDFVLDRFQYQAFVKTVMKLRVSCKAWNSSIGWATTNFWRKCSRSVLNDYPSILLHCLTHVMSHPIRVAGERLEFDPQFPTEEHRICISVPTRPVGTTLHDGLSLLLISPSSSSSSSFHSLGFIACHSLMSEIVWSFQSTLSFSSLVQNLKWD
jgi:hypothetical protein